MLDSARDNAIANHKTYGNVEAQHRLFGELRRDDPVHWTKPDGYRPFWTISKYADIIEIERQPDLAEEMLRWVSRVKQFFRTAAAEYEIRGKKIKAGDSLFISYPSGNRDEDAFDRPFEFVPDRTPNRHLGFGFGIHACIGRHLAKAEIVAFFRELLSRIDHVELAGNPAWTETSFLGGLKRLPVRYRAR
jgi:cytochrome P450